VSDAHINNAAIDRYTSAHFGVGATAAAFGVPWWLALAGSIAWEVAEDALKDKIPTAFPYSSHDSLLNASTDTIAVMAGWGAATLALRQPTVSDRAGLEATVGATLGAVALPVVSFLGHVVGSPSTTGRARLAYGIGTGLGAMLGEIFAIRRRAAYTPLPVAAGQALVTGAGGALAGPMGAGMAAYLASAGVKAAMGR
jgi:hypothetical protein